MHGVRRQASFERWALLRGDAFSGGLCASIFTMTLYLGEPIPVAPATGHAWWQAGLVELFCTLVLAFVVLSVAASKRHGGKSQFYSIAVGFVIAAGAYGAGRISGGCLTPPSRSPWTSAVP